MKAYIKYSEVVADLVGTLKVLVRETVAHENECSNGQRIEHPEEEGHEVDKRQNVTRHDKCTRNGCLLHTRNTPSFD